MTRPNRSMMWVLLAVVALVAVLLVPRVGARGTVSATDEHIDWIAERGNNQAFRFGTLSQDYADDVPWTLEADPELITIDWDGPQDSFPYYSSNNRQRHGVASPGEGRDFQDSLSPGESLTFSAGDALAGRAFTGMAIKIDNAGNQGVVVAATASLGGSVVDLYMYDADCGAPPAETQDTITIQPNDDLKLFCFDGEAPFDTITFTAESGRFGFAGFEPHSKLYVTDGPAPNTTVDCGDEEGTEVLGDEVDVVLTAECDAGKESVAVYVNSFQDGTNRFLDVVFPGGGDGTALVRAVTIWDPEPAGTAHQPTKVDYDPFDGVDDFVDSRFCSEIDGALPTEDEPVCTEEVNILDAGDGEVVRTETFLFYGDPRALRPS